MSDYSYLPPLQRFIARQIDRVAAARARKHALNLAIHELRTSAKKIRAGTEPASQAAKAEAEQLEADAQRKVIEWYSADRDQKAANRWLNVGMGLNVVFLVTVWLGLSRLTRELIDGTLLTVVRDWLLGPGFHYLKAGSVVTAGVLLFAFRAYLRRAYAVLELVIALATADFYVRTVADPTKPEAWVPLAGAVYFIVRGLDNYAVGQAAARKRAEEREEEKRNAQLILEGTIIGRVPANRTEHEKMLADARRKLKPWWKVW